MNRLVSLCGISALLALTACGEPDVRLAGERLDLDGVSKAQENSTSFVSDRLTKAVFPSKKTNSAWTHRGGSAVHYISNPSWSGEAVTAWRLPFGNPQDKRHFITASPIVADERIFAMDSYSTVASVSTSGQLLWQRDLTPLWDDSKDASGGGLAHANGVVFATTGFGEMYALDAATGDIMWTQDLDSFTSGAPTIFDGIVYLTTQDGAAWAVDADTGRIKWQLAGNAGIASSIHGAGPAVTAKWAIFPFGTGEIMTTFRKGGLSNWTAAISGQRAGMSAGVVNNLTTDPVVVASNVYVGNANGLISSMDVDTGDRNWTAQHGTQGQLNVAGNSVFAVSDQSRLIRLDRNSGDLQWAVSLPRFTTEKVKKQKQIVAHFGPVLAGNVLVLGSSDGFVRVFDPQAGTLLKSVAIDASIASEPAVAGGVMYFVTSKAELIALQ